MPPTQSAFERCFVAHGQSYGLRAQDGDLLDRLAARVPLGWHASAVTLPEISTWYLLRRADDPEAPYRLAVNGESLIESASLPVVLDAFERHAELLAAERAARLALRSRRRRGMERTGHRHARRQFRRQDDARAGMARGGRDVLLR